MLKAADAYVFEIKRLAEQNPKLNNTIVNVLLRHLSINNALTAKENLLKGNVANIPVPYLIEIAKELNIKNYEQYFSDEDEIKIGEVLNIVNLIEKDHLNIIKRLNKIEKKVGE